MNLGTAAGRCRSPRGLRGSGSVFVESLRRKNAHDIPRVEREPTVAKPFRRLADLRDVMVALFYFLSSCRIVAKRVSVVEIPWEDLFFF